MALFGLIPSRRREVVVYVGGRSRDKILGMPVDEVYRTQPELQAVVSFLASSIAQLPLKCYLRESDESRPRDTEGVLPQLLGNPGVGVTGYQLVLQTASDLLLYGWALWWVLPSADTESGWEMRSISPMWVQTPKTIDGFQPSSFTINNPDTNGLSVEVPASQFVRFMTYNPGHPTMPLSPVDGLKQVLEERASSREYRNKVWQNGGWFSRYIERPAQDTEWSPEARKRFASSIKNLFGGPEGVDSGGIPILEDGMKFVDSTLNAKEAEWAESMRLTREDVAAAYHVNPASVWSSDGQTYASVKENARSLYADTLGPTLRLIQDVVRLQLVPMIGADRRSYAEFDLSAKLAGSFEEQATVLSQSVGGPWMTRNEARARQNLPAIEGGDELIVPMNVTEGGLASPHDTDPTQGYGYSYRPTPKAASGRRSDPAPQVKRSKAEPDDESVDEITAVLRHFAERQSRRVLANLGDSGGEKAADEEDDAWWDEERWNRELADDLEGVFQTLANLQALATLFDLGRPSDTFSAARMVAFIRSMAESRAQAYNAVTYRQLKDARSGEAGEGNLGSTVEGVFEMAAGSRAERAGRSFATSVASFGTTEAARQTYEGDRKTEAWKVWHHNPSGKPRSEHARMDGERVRLDEKFSNGAMWPGDSVLGPTQTCNCHCTMEIEVEEADGTHSTREPLTKDEQRTVDEVASKLGFGDDYNPYAVHDAYEKCQVTVGHESGEWSTLTIKERDEILAELGTRDADWVSYGTVKPPTFNPASLEDEIRSKRPHELATGERIAHHGIVPAFQDDQRVYFDEALGLSQIVGLADLENGYELKTLATATESSIDTYLRGLNKKEGVEAVVFDNTDGKGLTDSALIDFIRGSRRWSGRAYVLCSNGELIRAK